MPEARPAVGKPFRPAERAVLSSPESVITPGKPLLTADIHLNLQQRKTACAVFADYLTADRTSATGTGTSGTNSKTTAETSKDRTSKTSASISEPFAPPAGSAREATASSSATSKTSSQTSEDARIKRERLEAIRSRLRVSVHVFTQNWRHFCRIPRPVVLRALLGVWAAAVRAEKRRRIERLGSSSKGAYEERDDRSMQSALGHVFPDFCRQRRVFRSWAIACQARTFLQCYFGARNDARASATLRGRGLGTYSGSNASLLSLSFHEARRLHLRGSRNWGAATGSQSFGWHTRSARDLKLPRGNKMSTTSLSTCGETSRPPAQTTETLRQKRTTVSMDATVGLLLRLRSSLLKRKALSRWKLSISEMHRSRLRETCNSLQSYNEFLLNESSGTDLREGSRYSVP